MVDSSAYDRIEHPSYGKPTHPALLWAGFIGALIGGTLLAGVLRPSRESIYRERCANVTARNPESYEALMCQWNIAHGLMPMGRMFPKRTEE
jgi:hypothetical protein